MRSIQSFDAKYDIGRAQAPNDGAPFNNFTQEENQGKGLFLAPPQFNPQGQRIGGGAGCAGCHRPPEFDIDPNSRNNGFLQAIGGGTDFTNTRAPSLRDLVNTNGELNGPMMHHGSVNSLSAVIAHYNSITSIPNTNIDPRLVPGGNGQQLNLTQQETDQLVAFLRTLSGTDVYTNEKWSDPFDANGNITILGGSVTTAIDEAEEVEFSVYPNPTSDYLNIALGEGSAITTVSIYDNSGRMVREFSPTNLSQSPIQIEVFDFPTGVYHLAVLDESKALRTARFVVTR